MKREEENVRIVMQECKTVDKNTDILDSTHGGDVRVDEGR